MSLIDGIEIVKFIRNLRKERPSLTCDELKEILTSRDNDAIYYLNCKEDDDLMLVYYDNIPHKIDPNLLQLENDTRSCILEKTSLNILATQFNKVIYNGDAVSYLQYIPWTCVTVEECYEGTTLLVYFYNNKWYISTRRCLDAGESAWIKNKSYREMFEEAITGKFTLNDLSKDNVYYFILLHYKNKNIVNYTYLGDEYMQVVHTLTTKKFTLEEVDYVINDKIMRSNKRNYENLDALLKALCDIDDDNREKRRITTEGFTLRAYKGELHKSPFKLLKVQTDIYQTLMKLKPNNSNTCQSHLELYQKNKLKDYLIYFTKHYNPTINRIHTSMKNLSSELLNLYHNTRNKQNKEVYNGLKEQYKKVLYGLHGLYIKMKKPKPGTVEMEGQKSVTIHDVYFYLKNLPPEQLRQLYHERMELIEEGNIDAYIDKDCIYLKTMTVLMFPKEND